MNLRFVFILAVLSCTMSLAAAPERADAQSADYYYEFDPDSGVYYAKNIILGVFYNAPEGQMTLESPDTARTAWMCNIDNEGWADLDNAMLRFGDYSGMVRNEYGEVVGVFSLRIDMDFIREVAQNGGRYVVDYSDTDYDYDIVEGESPPVMFMLCIATLIVVLVVIIVIAAMAAQKKGKTRQYTAWGPAPAGPWPPAAQMGYPTALPYTQPAYHGQAAPVSAIPPERTRQQIDIDGPLEAEAPGQSPAGTEYADIPSAEPSLDAGLDCRGLPEPAQPASEGTVPTSEPPIPPEAKAPEP